MIPQPAVNVVVYLEQLQRWGWYGNVSHDWCVSVVWFKQLFYFGSFTCFRSRGQLTRFSAEMTPPTHTHTLLGGTFSIYACLFVFFSLVIFGGWGWPTSTHSHTCSSLQPIYSPPVQKNEQALLATFRQIVVDSNMVILVQREDSSVRPRVHKLFTLTFVPLVSVCHSTSTLSSIAHPVLQGVFVKKIPQNLLAYLCLQFGPGSWNTYVTHTKYIFGGECDAVDCYMI